MKTLDTRDLYKRKCELESLRDAVTTAREELEELETLENEISDFKHGETMIPENDFEDYARQFAEDIGAMEGVGDKWPCTCIDWERAARELAMDYSTVEYQGDTYLVRS